MACMGFEFRVLCLIALMPLGSPQFICPGPLYPKHGFSYASIEPNISGREIQEFAKIRIKLHHDSSIENKPYKGLVQEAADFWANALAVKPVTGRIFMSRDCNSETDTFYKATAESKVKLKHCLGSCARRTKCFDFEIPNQHLDGCRSCKGSNLDDCSKDEGGRGTGYENADLVFYVTADNSIKNCVGRIVAYAGMCDLDPVNDRPLFTLINICPLQAAGKSMDYLLRTIKHEMLHALGFGFHKLWRDQNGEPYWPRNETTGLLMPPEQAGRVFKTIEREWHVRGDVIKSKRAFLVTPKVTKEAQKYFNCSDLEGVELEDSGPEGSRHSHFEARVFYDDGMKSNVDSGKGLFSRLDYAVLDDSGWYQVYYSQAEEMNFGKNLGCDFCKKSCKFWMDKNRDEGKSIEPYCDSPDLKTGRGFSCIGTKKLFTGCPLIDLKRTQEFTGLPREYQNFDKIPGVESYEVSDYGSLDSAADYCPIPVREFAIPGMENGCLDRDDPEWPKKDGKNPFEDEEDEDDESRNHSSHLVSSSQLVYLLACMCIIIMIPKGQF